MIGEKELFALGYRKAYLTSERSNGFVFETFGEKYPFVEMQMPSNHRIRIFFQDEGTKKQFEEKGFNIDRKDEEVTLPYNSREVGKFLGFPKVAIKDYEKGISNEEKALIEYHGLSFVIKKKNIKKALKQLQKEMRIPEKIANLYHSSIKVYDYSIEKNTFVLKNDLDL